MKKKKDKGKESNHLGDNETSIAREYPVAPA